MIEVKPAIGLLQGLTIRKWQEHPSGAAAAPPESAP